MSDELDPWSKDVPVAPPPTDFTFREPRVDTDEPQVATNPLTDDAPVEIAAASRRRWIGAGVGLGVVIAGVATASLLRDSPDRADATVDSTIAPEPTTADELPEAVTPSSPPTTARPSATTVPDPDAPPPGTWIKGLVVLPERLTEFEVPTQLVALSNEGLVIEIDLPSGATTTLDVDRRLSGATLHVRERVALITGNGGGAAFPPIIVERGEPPIPVDVPAGAGQFFVYNEDSNVGEFRAEVFDSGVGSSGVFIGLDGTITEVEESTLSLYYGQFEVATGERLAYGGGDWFLTSPPDADEQTSRRITTGDLLGRSPVALFVDECDEQQVCGKVLIDVVTGDRTAVPDPEGLSFDRNVLLSSMSPDGAAVLLNVTQGNDVTIAATVYDFATGDTRDVDVPRSPNFGSARVSWAIDGSGFFVVDGGAIVFVDRFTGESIELPIEFPTTDAIVDVRARPLPSS